MIRGYGIYVLLSSLGVNEAVVEKLQVLLFYITSDNALINRNFESGGYPALDSGLPLPVDISLSHINYRMATFSDRFRGAVDEFLSGSTDSAVPMEEIILLAQPSGTATAPGADDPTESLLGALKWGLRQYGLHLYSGYRFFCALARLGSMLPQASFRVLREIVTK
ncbi:hypothetical protein BGX38DRAFT_1328834 [Terfezia claveryi]|nr:hypothetical protein BGX38DRAFT_1328834 [Terfezia claveryi]